MLALDLTPLRVVSPYYQFYYIVSCPFYSLIMVSLPNWKLKMSGFIVFLHGDRMNAQWALIPCYPTLTVVLNDQKKVTTLYPMLVDWKHLLQPCQIYHTYNRSCTKDHLNWSCIVEAALWDEGYRFENVMQPIVRPRFGQGSLASTIATTYGPNHLGLHVYLP